jgi:hypothetical protein
MEPRYDLRVVESQKDAFQILVHVEERLSPEEYRRIAEVEVQRFLAARAPGEVPVYEVRLDFLLSAPHDRKDEKLATFWWTSRNGEFASTMLPEGEHMLVLY